MAAPFAVLFAGPRRPTQSDFARMVRARDDRLSILIRQLDAGKSPEWFAREFEKALRKGHAEASRLGRRRGDPSALPSRRDALRASRWMKEDAPYLAGFVSDLRSGRYGQSGAWNGGAIRSRARLYFGKFGASAAEGYGETSRTRWRRFLGAGEHCSTCPAKAREYSSFAQMRGVGLPRDGSDECRTGCKCGAAPVGGLAAFDVPAWDPPAFLTPARLPGSPVHAPAATLRGVEPEELRRLLERVPEPLLGGAESGALFRVRGPADTPGEEIELVLGYDEVHGWRTVRAIVVEAQDDEVAP